MRWNGWTHALAAMLTTGIILLIAGVVFLGPVAIARAPLFDWQIALRGRQLLEVSNSPQCLPELPFFQQAIARFGQPVLDLACGTGRLLVPLLYAGIDIDGCDISGDMLQH